MPKLPTEGITFEKVWASLQETDREMKENDRKLTEKLRQMSEEITRVNREVAERQRETARLVDRVIEETEKQMKETDRQLGKLGNRFGELAEHLVAPGIIDKFNSLGFHFSEISKDRAFRDPQTRRPLAEVDIFLENGDVVIAVEVKSKLDTQDVDEHLSRMEVLRGIADRKGDRRRYRGAMAGAIVTDATRSSAAKAGLYLLEQSGDTMKLDIPEGFLPREW